MEGNLCDVNHLESNARLPPRKRLLVGLKNQNAAVYGNRHLSSSSSSSTSAFSPSSGYDVLINKWIGSQENNDNRSPEDIIKASMVAVKTAEEARSRAESKAAYAARAIDMAKEALEVSASIAEKFARRERRVKKAKMKMKMKKKKQVQVQSVRILSRKPRQTKNSNSQVNVNQSSSNPKSNVRNKRLKGKQIPENLDDDPSDELKSDGSSEETHSVGSDENPPSISIRIDDSGAETSQLKKSGGQSLNISSRTGVKKSRFNQKNFPY